MFSLIDWFEIPVTDLNRAIEFYSHIFSYSEMPQIDLGGFKMAFFPSEAGALCMGEFYKPSNDGVVLYFSANPDLNVVLSKVEAAGGKIIMPKKQISEQYGYMALFTDSEGNRLALHSTN